MTNLATRFASFVVAVQNSCPVNHDDNDPAYWVEQFDPEGYENKDELFAVAKAYFA
jgi:hypothetical protein